MSEPTGRDARAPVPLTRRYASLLARGQLRWMFVGAFLGRVPYAMESIGTVVFIRSATGSYAAAGLVGGAVAAGIAAGSVVQGRRADRAGRAALMPLGVAHLLLMCTLVLGGLAGWPTAVLAVLGCVVGASVAPTSPVFRTLYPDVLVDDPPALRAAFALDSALTDVTYIAGPALVSVGVLVASPGAALVFAAGAALASVLVLLLRGPAAGPARSRDVGARRVSALGAPGILTLTLATLPLGTAFGVCEVAYPAFGSSQGELALGGLVLSLAGISSCLSALKYGASSSRHPTSVFVRQSLWLAPVFVAPAAGSSVVAVALLTVPLGAVAGPWTVARNQLIARLALPGTAVEAYSWPVTALLAGTALGAACAGPLVEHGGWRPALVVAGLVAGLTGLLAVRQHVRIQVPA